MCMVSAGSKNMTNIGSDIDGGDVMANEISGIIHFEAHKSKNQVFSNNAFTWMMLTSAFSALSLHLVD